MFKDAVARIVLILMGVMVFTACSSCVSNSYLFGEGNLFRHKRRSFVKIKTQKSILVVKTSTVVPDRVVEDYTFSFASVASGVILSHYRDTTLIATSAHVCTMKYGKQLNHFIPEYSPHKNNWHVLEKNNFSLFDISGKIYEGVILKIDLMSDLCLLLTKSIPQPHIAISTMDPLVGEKYYNIAAPHGIWGKRLIPLFEGRFVGKVKSPFTDAPSYMFTVPAAGGSSGSPIINWYGDLVGLIHSAYGSFHHVSMAATNRQLQVLLSGSLMKLRKQYDAYKVILSINN
jgi:hypothetical protein|tara:strand:- start:843 stop:1703 length:861 start_codon:yes stop_codon:yes gene_type:complete